MREAEWLAGIDTRAMMVHLQTALAGPLACCTPRKLRAFSIACLILSGHPRGKTDYNAALETGKPVPNGRRGQRKPDASPEWAMRWASLYGEQSFPSTPDSSGRAALLRDIFGNPFRPVAVEPIWRTATVSSLGAAIYADRAFDRLPILADALEDAGCTNVDVLDHCRQPGDHVNGCWVVDLVLGKE